MSDRERLFHWLVAHSSTFSFLHSWRVQGNFLALKLAQEKLLYHVWSNTIHTIQTGISLRCIQVHPASFSGGSVLAVEICSWLCGLIWPLDVLHSNTTTSWDNASPSCPCALIPSLRQYITQHDPHAGCDLLIFTRWFLFCDIRHEQHLMFAPLKGQGWKH